MEVLKAQDAFAVPEAATERPPGWPPTRYEAKAVREGRHPLYWSLRRR
jgi:tRNA (guanine-N7-)-methyltransferase